MLHLIQAPHVSTTSCRSCTRTRLVSPLICHLTDMLFFDDGRVMPRSRALILMSDSWRETLWPGMFRLDSKIFGRQCDLIWEGVG
jgi:hypothetical protein